MAPAQLIGSMSIILDRLTGILFRELRTSGYARPPMWRAHQRTYQRSRSALWKFLETEKGCEACVEKSRNTSPKWKEKRETKAAVIESVQRTIECEDVMEMMLLNLQIT